MDVPSTIAQRQTRALAAAGYTHEHIAHLTGLQPLSIARAQDGAIVGHRAAHTITKAYKYIETTTGGRILPDGPTTEAIIGEWEPPAAWDNIEDIAEDHTLTRIATGPIDRLAAELVNIVGTPVGIYKAYGISPSVVRGIIDGHKTPTPRSDAMLRTAWCDAVGIPTVESPYVRISEELVDHIDAIADERDRFLDKGDPDATTGIQSIAAATGISYRRLKDIRHKNRMWITAEERDRLVLAIAASSHAEAVRP